jgi:hypothetical protein
MTVLSKAGARPKIPLPQRRLVRLARPLAARYMASLVGWPSSNLAAGKGLSSHSGSQIAPHHLSRSVGQVEAPQGISKPRKPGHFSISGGLCAFQPLASRAFIPLPPGSRGLLAAFVVLRGRGLFLSRRSAPLQQPRPSTGSRSWRYKAEHGFSARYDHDPRCFARWTTLTKVTSMTFGFGLSGLL